jgi:hypothetical protein
MSRFIKRPSPAAVIASLALVVALGGIAYAQIPSSDGTFYGCVAKSGSVAHSKGDLRVVEQSEACRNYEFPVSWNQQGPPGQPGQPGQPGAPATALWAVINPDGSVARGSHVVGSFRAQTGLYFVQFDRQVNNCAFSVTPDGTQRAGSTLGTPSQTQVEALVQSTATGQSVDSTVSVAVFC